MHRTLERNHGKTRVGLRTLHPYGALKRRFGRLPNAVLLHGLCAVEKVDIIPLALPESGAGGKGHAQRGSEYVPEQLVHVANIRIS